MKRFLRGWSYVKRTIRTRIIITEFDKLCPFEGPIAEDGFCSLELSPKTLVELQTVLKPALECPQQDIVLNVEVMKIIEKILIKIEPLITAYIGKNVFLDGINLDIKEGRFETRSISSNWHTDNVGARIKVFVCINGNGEFPTLIIPSKKRLHSTYSWLFNSAIELFRWAGFTQRTRLAKQKVLIHKAGSINIFDTNLLHRGGYESKVGKRVLFQLEFSNPDKHKVAHGPIGTTDENYFKFSSECLEFAIFNKFLDFRRVHKSHGNIFAYKS